MSNPTKANSLSMPEKGNKAGRPPLPGNLTKKEREAKKAAQEAYEAEKARREDAAASQGAAGGGGDEERQKQIQEFNNFLRAAEAAAADDDAAAEARLKEAVAAEKAHSAKAVPSSGKKGLFSNIPGSGVGMGESKQWRAQKEAEQARNRVKVAGKENVERAREFLARLKSGENYAALVAERDAVQAQRQEESEVPVSKEVYQQQLAAAQEASRKREREVNAAIAWAKAQPEIWKKVYSVNDTPTQNNLIALYKQAEAAAGRGSE